MNFYCQFNKVSDIWIGSVQEMLSLVHLYVCTYMYIRAPPQIYHFIKTEMAGRPSFHHPPPEYSSPVLGGVVQHSQVGEVVRSAHDNGLIRVYVDLYHIHNLRHKVFPVEVRP